MPYPIALAVAAAASAAGTGLQMAGDAKSKRGMQRTRTAETDRQKRFQEQADATFQASLAKSGRDTAEAETTAGADKRKAAYADMGRQTLGAASLTPATTTGTTGAGGASARNKASVTATNNAWSGIVTDAQARLGGVDDWGLNRSIRNRRTRQDLAITSTNARRSSGLLGLEMDVARQQGDALRGWGSLTAALGSVAGAAAGTMGGGHIEEPPAGDWGGILP